MTHHRDALSGFNHDDHDHSYGHGDDRDNDGGRSYSDDYGHSYDNDYSDDHGDDDTDVYSRDAIFGEGAGGYLGSGESEASKSSQAAEVTEVPTVPQTVGEPVQIEPPSASGEGAVATGGVRVVRVGEIELTSALKVGFIINSALCLVWILAMTVLWIILNLVGVWGRMNSLFQDLLGLDGVSSLTYFGLVIVLGLIELVIFTLCAPIAAMIYNSAASLAGGLKVRLER